MLSIRLSLCKCPQLVSLLDRDFGRLRLLFCPLWTVLVTAGPSHVLKTPSHVVGEALDKRSAPSGPALDTSSLFSLHGGCYLTLYPVGLTYSNRIVKPFLKSLPFLLPVSKKYCDDFSSSFYAERGTNRLTVAYMAVAFGKESYLIEWEIKWLRRESAVGSGACE